MVVKNVSSASSPSIVQQINITTFPAEVITRIFSYLLNFDCRSYVCCLLTCRRLYNLAKNDPLLPKKLTLFQMQFFCNRNFRVELERPNEYDPESLDIEKYENLLPMIDEMIRSIALREARGVEGKYVARTTVYTIRFKDLRRKTLKEIEETKEVQTPQTREKPNDKAENTKIADELAKKINEGKLPADAKSLLTAIRSFRLRHRPEELFLATLEKLAPLDLPKTETIVASIEKKLHDKSFYEAAQVEVLKVRAITDPSTAFQLAFDLRHLNGSPAFADIFKIILQQNFETAEKLALDLNPKNENRDTALYEMIKILVSKDINKAWTYMRQIQDEDFMLRKVINYILTYAYQNNLPAYQLFVANSRGEKQTTADLILEISIQLEAQKDITAAKTAAENIRDPMTKGKAWLAILIFLASHQGSKRDIDEAITHLQGEDAQTMMGPLASSNLELALSLTLPSPPSKQRDAHIMQIIDTLRERNFANAVEIALHMTNPDERDRHLLYLSEYDAGIESLDFMKAVAKIMLSSQPRIKHFDSLKFICASIKGWLK